MNSDTLLLTDHFYNSLPIRHGNPDHSDKIKLTSCRSELIDVTHSITNYNNQEENPEENQSVPTVETPEKPLKEKSITLLSETLNNKECYQSDEHTKASQNAHNENNSTVMRHSNPGRNSSQIRRLHKYSVEQLLHISTSNIDFGAIFPGQVVDESLEIVNKTNQNLVVEIYLNCENPDFEDTEEYVYSIRRSHLYDFNDKHYLIMTPYSSASFKVTLKGPCAKKTCDNKGSMDIFIQGIESSFRVQLESKIAVPKVFCPKALFHRQTGCDIINLIAKEGRKSEFKLPIKNTSDIPVSLELSFYSSNQEDDDPSMYCCVYPEMMNISEGGTSIMTFIARSRNIVSEDKDDSLEVKKKSYKKVVLARVGDTSLVYTFFVNVEIY